MESGVGNLLRKHNRRRPKRQSTGSSASKNVKRKYSSGSMYLVEDIIDERIYKGQKQYRVRWQGFPPDQDSWEPQRNLTNVLDVIEDFHRRSDTTNTSKMCEAVKHFSISHNSPASVPTPPSTPGSSSANIQKRSRGASEEPVEDSLPKRKSRITGRFEYVPKNQLVASKTKYFDDIRDGKIDLSQNDLYSRVKTRRRAAEASSDSVHDDENEGDSASFDQGKRETNSPISDCLQNTDSFSGFHSSIASVESERLKSSRAERFRQASEISKSRSLPDLANPTVVDEFEESSRTDATENINEIYCQSTDVTCNRDFSPATRSPITENIGSQMTTNIIPSTSLELPTNDMVVNSSHVTSTSLVNSDRRPSSSSVEKVVSSLRDLVAAYFRLLFGNHQNRPISTPDRDKPGESPEEAGSAVQRATELLDSLPRLVTYSPLARIQTHEELIEAINNQRWTLLASVLFEDRGETPSSVDSATVAAPEPSVGQQPPPGSLEQILQLQFPNEVDRTNAIRQIVLAVIVGGAGRPSLLESLLATGLDPDTVVSYDAGASSRCEQANWPLLLLAVRLHRLHAAQVLLQAGAQPNCVVASGDQSGPARPRRTALGLAIATGDVDMASMLLLSGANFYEVEPGITALNLITELLRQHSSGNPPNVATLPPQSGDGVDPIQLAELQDRLRSIDSCLPVVPAPSPPEGTRVPSLPRSVLLTAVLNSAAFRSAATCDATLAGSSGSGSPILLPSVDSLNRLYNIVAVHHARLSVSVTRLVRRWLARAGLIQTALVSPCTWVSIHQRTVVVDFSWPIANLTELADANPQLSAGPVAPLLVLVHGRVAPPACYDVWMDDDGPCLIDRVCLDDVYLQRPLGRVPFVTTLYPVRRRLPKGAEPTSHRVTVKFCHRLSSAAQRLAPTCFAIMIIAVRLDHPPVGGLSAVRSGLVPQTPRGTPGQRLQQQPSTSCQGSSSTRDAATSSFHSQRSLPSQSRQRSLL